MARTSGGLPSGDVPAPRCSVAAWEMKLYQEGERRALWTWGEASALGKGSDGPGPQRYASGSTEPWSNSGRGQVGPL